jgi:hypothetical protein
MGKGVRNMRKGVRNIRNTFRNIMIQRLICFLIRIVWLRRCPILSPGSDVRALAVPCEKCPVMEVEDASRATTCFVANFAVDQSKCTTCTLQVTTAHIYNRKGEHCVLRIIHAMGCPGVRESVCVTCSSCSCTCGRRQGGCGEVGHGCGAFWSRGSFVRALQFDHGCLGLLITLESRQLEQLQQFVIICLANLGF